MSSNTEEGKCDEKCQCLREGSKSFPTPRGNYDGAQKKEKKKNLERLMVESALEGTGRTVTD